MIRNKIGPRERGAARILIVDDSPASQVAEKALREKNLSFIRKQASEEIKKDYKVPCLLSGEGRFSGKQLIVEYAETIDQHIKNGR